MKRFLKYSLSLHYTRIPPLPTIGKSENLDVLGDVGNLTIASTRTHQPLTPSWKVKIWMFWEM